MPKLEEEVDVIPAPPTYVAPNYAPPARTIERQGQRSEAYTEYYPRVTGGICEFCGVVDNKMPATEQYKLCVHFKDMGELRCSYCPETVNPEEVVYHSTLNIHGHPDNPQKLVVVCDAYNCSRAHEARFKRNS